MFKDIKSKATGIMEKKTLTPNIGGIGKSYKILGCSFKITIPTIIV